MKGIFKKVLYAGIMCFVSSISCLGFAGCSNEQDNNQNHTPTWFSGTTNVQYVSDGDNGDFYYDTDDYSLYQKENGEWVLKVENFGKPTTADNIELQVSSGQIQWRYKTGADKTWKKLIEISTLKGQNGYTPYIQDGYWYINGVNQNIPATGTSAKNIEIQKGTNAIQWRYVGDSNWNDLVSLSLIEGNDGSDGKSVKIAVNDSNIQWRYTDNSNDWQTIIDIDSLKGSDGKTPHIDSVTGNWFIGNVDTGYRASAIDGREIVLQTTENYIQWKYVGDNEWNNLIALSLLKGEDGATWLCGEIVPSTEGKNGDFYLNTSNYDVYKKQNDKWDKIGNIKASDGIGIKSIIKTSSEGLVDTYTITYTDNTTSTFSITNGEQGVQGIQGVPGKDGVGIEVAEIDGTGNLILKLSNNNVLNLGKIVGNNGTGIEKIEKTSTVDNVDNYSISYSDGTTFEYSVVNGVNGKDGNDGENGKDGVGIKSIIKTSSNGLVDTYTITYTNNSTTTFNIVNGADGEKGETGATGEKGEAGESGNGIAKIEKEKSEDNIDTYKILFTNGSYTTFTISNGINGNGIKTIAKTSSNGLVDTYTINYTDGSYTTYTVTNGADGLSAYEIYKIYNPSYTKTEQEWIIDLVNGDLATNTYTVTFNSNGGSDVPAQSNIKYAGKATKPTTPPHKNRLFICWLVLGRRKVEFYWLFGYGKYYTYCNVETHKI